MEYPFVIRLIGIVEADSYDAAEILINEHLDQLGAVDSGNNLSWSDCEYDIEVGADIGECDFCDYTYDVGSQLDHCGSCGTCWNHCDHTTNIEEE